MGKIKSETGIVTGKLIEIFASIQGEGLWVGRPQVFVRFHGCRLQCTYCDTPLTHHKINSCRIEEVPFTKQFKLHDLSFSAEQLNQIIQQFGIPNIALTGGEPLEQADFIAEWLGFNNPGYEVLLETNGIEVEGLLKVKDHISLISMDIKLPSSSREKPLWDEHRAFLQAARGVPTYLKIVYDETMSAQEMNYLENIIFENPDVSGFIFQPVSPLQKRELGVCLNIYWQFAKKYPQKVRLIPQTHKILQVL